MSEVSNLLVAAAVGGLAGGLAGARTESAQSGPSSPAPVLVYYPSDGDLPSYVAWTGATGDGTLAGDVVTTAPSQPIMSNAVFASLPVGHLYRLEVTFRQLLTNISQIQLVLDAGVGGSISLCHGRYNAAVRDAIGVMKYDASAEVAAVLVSNDGNLARLAASPYEYGCRASLLFRLDAVGTASALGMAFKGSQIAASSATVATARTAVSQISLYDLGVAS